VVGPVTLDTGSNGGIALFQSALDLPGVRASITENGMVTHQGFRGATIARSYVFNSPVGFGPFSVPPGQPVMLHDEKGSKGNRVANVGNKLFDAMGLKVLLNYPARMMTFYGDC
jgi:hypothetical protein